MLATELYLDFGLRVSSNFNVLFFPTFFAHELKCERVSNFFRYIQEQKLARASIVALNVRELAPCL